ncbi:Acyl-coenzyme A:6-aminopenicillanic-acid-acyltransferase 40 kDa form [Lachnellula hyalina]|uniref:Acyl-coenzyme A:6-aminopenicillanic-acid-acyltransferase 40 kDa form n=1 Tax=Lachnellula hyalina TaxID=1316788 RepID=A0A8H8R837_9HELO|nr:Acyl-coenzyme A:6-aminopenicillanic-acid-acyltransferase 40 kDa form [Lachnellula hyalina]TVY28549.1 Acyl-coenzyme A:6-aminopenicillanic-acid-acyltransferase 40 kDa form [Lachnellula hyalina]
MDIEKASSDIAATWNGVPEVIASGSPWEVGFAHGSQIPLRIAVCISNYERLFLETAEADWAESKARAATYLPALEENEADLVEEMRGIASGAGRDFLDILALNLRSEIALTNYSDGCTSIVTRNAARGEVYLAQNWDWVAEAGSSTAFFDIQGIGQPRIRMMGEAGMVGKFGFNDSGVGICMNAIRCGTVNKSHLPVHLAMRRVLECRSFDEALAMLTSKGLASCVNLVIADNRGRMATIECTPKGLAPIFPEPGSWTTFHTNHLWSPDIPDGIRDHPSKNSFSRLERIKVLSKDQEANIEKIRLWLSDEEGTPVSICRSTPEKAVGIERMATLATVIFDLQKFKAEVSFGKPSLSPPVRTLSIE